MGHLLTSTSGECGLPEFALTVHANSQAAPQSGRGSHIPPPARPSRGSLVESAIEPTCGLRGDAVYQRAVDPPRGRIFTTSCDSTPRHNSTGHHHGAPAANAMFMTSLRCTSTIVYCHQCEDTG
jgi:hypothetical protein